MRFMFLLFCLAQLSLLRAHAPRGILSETEASHQHENQSKNKVSKDIENYYANLFINYNLEVKAETDPAKLSDLKQSYAQALLDCDRLTDLEKFLDKNDFTGKTSLQIKLYLANKDLNKAKKVLNTVREEEDYQTAHSYFQYLIAELEKDEESMEEAYKRLYAYYRRKKRGRYCRAHELKHIARVFEKKKPYEAWQMYQKSIKRNSKDIETFLLATYFCQSKFAANFASEIIKKAIRLNPHHPEALVLHASVLIDEGELKSAEDALNKSLRAHPKHPNAITQLARVLSYNKEYKTELERIQESLKAYPNSIKLLSRLAAWETLHGNQNKAEAIIKKVRAINPQSNEIFLIISQAWEELFQFSKAVEYSKRAEEIDKNDWRVLHSIGQNLVRLGEEKEGYEYLERAFKLNSFNYWARNLLMVLDQDFLKNEFKTIETEHFICRIHKEQYPYLKDFLADVMENSYKNLVGKYKFEPIGPKHYKGKVLLILLKNHSDFSVRTAGIPGLGALGACFGQIITMPPPSIGKDPQWRFNWRWTFEHEFAHILTLQMTDYKIPRWLTEGISTFEEENPRKDIDHLIKWAWANKKLHKIETMNDGFFKQTYRGEIVVSYYHSSIIVQYIVENYGYEKLREILALYQVMDDDLEILKKALNEKDLQKNFDDYTAQFISKMPFRITINAEDFEALKAKNSLNEEEIFQTAWHSLSKKDYPAVAQDLKALKNCQDKAQFHSLEARLLEAKNNPLEQVISAYSKVLDFDQRNYKANKVVGLHLAQKLNFHLSEDTDKELRTDKLKAEELDSAQKAIKHLEKALETYPFCPDTLENLYLPLIRLYRASSQDDKVLDTLKRHAANNNESYQAQLDLAAELIKRRQDKEAKQSLINAAHVYPYLAQIYNPFALSLEGNAKFKEALEKFELALSCNERDQIALKGAIRCALKMGDEKIAQKYLNKLYRFYRDDDWDEWYDEVLEKTKA